MFERLVAAEKELGLETRDVFDMSKVIFIADIFASIYIFVQGISFLNCVYCVFVLNTD